MRCRLKVLALALPTLFLLAPGAPGQQTAGPSGPLYELRTYTAHPGKLDALNARFRDHTVKLFEKHGIRNLGYWVPKENSENKLIYVLEHASPEARQQSFRAFGADPAWQKARQESEANGPLVAKLESVLLRATDYSPKIRPAASGNRIFELRVYTASSGNLERLHARFRNHTLKLFEKHGMTNVGYWSVAPGQPGAENTLIYLLAHRSQEAARASFDAFRMDPAWMAARKASEEAAGGSLTAPQGVKSTFLEATDYSATR